jgi:cytoskeletal protein CcmA (bactofilin family)
VPKRRRDGELTVFIGASTELDGQLTFDGQARLDGKFKGEISGVGTLLVGADAKVQANIKATAVIVCGEVDGDVVATERIEMRAPGRLKGNITAPLVVMDEGVLFEGNCRMAGEEGKMLQSRKVAMLPAS